MSRSSAEETSGSNLVYVMSREVDPKSDVNRDIAEISIATPKTQSCKCQKAFVRGNARDMLKAAEALEALESGAPLEEVDLPPGAILDPTAEQMAKQCWPFVRLPAKIPKDSWHEGISMSASPPPSLDRAAIIAAHPLPDYCQARGFELKREGSHWKCLCPIHRERTPSFFLGPDPNVWHCFGCGAGGSVIDLHAALRGISIAEAMRELSPSAPSEPKEVAAYTYCDEDGYELFEVVRFWPKDFRQFKLDENGKRIWRGGLGDVRRVPYRLPEVLATDEVFVVEGEKDVEVLRAAGQTATCNPGGAGK
jgi:hypothetical protein